MADTPAMDNTTVKHIARLARIGLDPPEAAGYAAELSRILEFVEQMNSLDTENVEPLTHPRDRVLRLRADEVTESDQREAFQRAAPAVAAGLYLVPRVVE